MRSTLYMQKLAALMAFIIFSSDVRPPADLHHPLANLLSPMAAEPFGISRGPDCEYPTYPTEPILAAPTIIASGAAFVGWTASSAEILSTPLGHSGPASSCRPLTPAPQGRE